MCSRRRPGEAFTLNTQEPYQRGYVVKHDDRSDEQKAEDEAIERERRKVEEAAAKERERRASPVAGDSGLRRTRFLEEDSDDDSEDETTAGRREIKASPEKPAADRAEINRVDGVEGDATIRHTQVTGPWLLNKPNDVAVRHQPVGLRKMGLSERGRCKRAWERDAPFWYLGSMSRKEANDILMSLNRASGVLGSRRRSVELVLCYKNPEDTILQHSIAGKPHKWVDGPFRPWSTAN